MRKKSISEGTTVVEEREEERSGAMETLRCATMGSVISVAVWRGGVGW